MSERVSSMSPQRKDELEQELVGNRPFSVGRTAELAANLAEFARPIRKQNRPAGVLNERPQRAGRAGGIRLGIRKCQLAKPALGAVKPAAQKPAASELIIAGNVIAKGSKGGARLGHPRPDQLAAPHKRTVNGPPQRLPAKRGVQSVQLIVGVRERAVSTRKRTAERDIGGFGNVAIGA